MNAKRFIGWLFLFSLLLAACGPQGAAAASLPEERELDSLEVDAALLDRELPFRDIVDYCLEMGYQTKILPDENFCSEYKYCVFPDGKECQAKDILMGICGAEYTYCQQQGYSLEVKEGTLACVFPDGSYCPEVNYFFGDCQAGDIND